jgi:hypothetical protein
MGLACPWEKGLARLSDMQFQEDKSIPPMEVVEEHSRTGQPNHLVRPQSHWGSFQARRRFHHSRVDTFFHLKNIGELSNEKSTHIIRMKRMYSLLTPVSHLKRHESTKTWVHVITI